VKCASCEFESDNEKLFKAVGQTHSLRAGNLCLECFLNKEDPTYKILAGIWVLLGGAGLLLCFLLPNLSYGIWLLNTAFALLALLLCVVIHESGHALAGMIVGWRVFYVTLGRGPFCCEFRWMGVCWIFHAFPFSGFCIGTAKERSLYRLKLALFVLGGPIAICCACWLDGILFGLILFWNPLPERESDRLKYSC
jgi:hypothetical protein